MHVLDSARVINGVDQQALQTELQALLEDGDIDIVVVTQERQPVGTRTIARADAARLLEEWQVGGETGRGAVMLWNINPQAETARSGVALGAGFDALDARAVDDAVYAAVQPGLENQDWKSALTAGRLELESHLSAAPAASAAPGCQPSPARRAHRAGLPAATAADPRAASHRSPGRRSRTPSRACASTTTPRSSAPRRSTSSARPSPPSRSAPAPSSSSTRR